MSIDQNDREMIERIIYKGTDDLSVAIARSLERLEERLDAVEARIYGRLVELQDRIEADQQDILDKLEAEKQPF